MERDMRSTNKRQQLPMHLDKVGDGKKGFHFYGALETPQVFTAG